MYLRIRLHISKLILYNIILYQPQHEVTYNQPHSYEDHTESNSALEVQSIFTKQQLQLATEHCSCHHNCSLSLIESNQDIEDSIQLQDLFYPDEGFIN